jgi:hypothetical protein
MIIHRKSDAVTSAVSGADDTRPTAERSSARDEPGGQP